VAVNDDSLDRDPRLASLMAAAGGESPPAALDAAILAAARREVSARPLSATGGGGSESTTPRGRRNWYVPVSIAAVMVLSVSLVTLVHEEKGSELAQPPDTARVPSPATAPPALEAPAASADAVASRNATAPKPELAGETPASPSITAPAPDVSRDLAKRRAGQGAPAQPATAPAADARREPEERDLARKESTGIRPAPHLRDDDYAARASAQPSPAPPPARKPEPFPGAIEREAPATASPPPSPPPAVAATPAAETASPPGNNGGALESRARSQARRAQVRDALEEAPAAQADAASAVTGATKKVAPTIAGGTVLSPARQASRPPTTAALGSAQRPEQKPLLLWRDLEDQPAEKWLERIAQYRREGRDADAEAVRDEFQRRFPNHPAATR